MLEFIASPEIILIIIAPKGPKKLSTLLFKYPLRKKKEIEKGDLGSILSMGGKEHSIGELEKWQNKI